MSGVIHTRRGGHSTFIGVFHMRRGDHSRVTSDRLISCLPFHKLLVLDQPRFIDINIAEQDMQLPIQHRQSSEYGFVWG